VKASEDLAAQAAALDELANQEDTAGAVDAAIGATLEEEPGEPAAAVPAKPRRTHHKKKKKNPSDGAMKKPAQKPVPGGDAVSPGATNGAVEEIPDEFLKQAIATAANSGLQMLKRSGWTSPQTKMMTEEEFCHAAAHCIDAIRIKYMGNTLDQYGAEVSLVLLVAPWTIQNLMRIMDERRKSHRATRVDGIRKDAHVSGADSDGAAGNSHRSDDGFEKLPELGNVGFNNSGSGATHQAA